MLACGARLQASGYPLIDKTKFPNMKAMTSHAHSVGLKMGWSVAVVRGLAFRAWPPE